jgi:osmotically inducible protein OsmC
MSLKKNAIANWSGTGAERNGTLSTSNKFFDNTPYSFKSRFQNEEVL